MRTGWVVALALLASGAARAQPTLRQLLEAADQQNVDRRITLEQRARAAAEYRQAWTALLPSVTAQGTWTHNEIEKIIPFGADRITILLSDQLDGLLRFDLPLVDIGRWARMGAGAKASDAAELRAQLTADLVRRQVVSAYYGYAAALAVRDSALRTQAVADEQLKLMEVRLKAGAVTELELLRARAEAQRTRQVVADASNLVATTRRGLRTLTGADPGEQAGLPADDLTSEPSFEELEQRIGGLPAVRAAENDAEAAARIGWGNRLALVPTVGAQFTERFTNAPGLVGRTAIFNTGVTLTWRLDVPTMMGFEAARANEATAALAAEKARQQSRDQIHSDWQRLTAALTKVQAAQAQVEAGRRAADVAKSRFAVGAATQVDVIQAERDLFLAEVGHISARTELATARVALRISAGLPLGIQ